MVFRRFVKTILIPSLLYTFDDKRKFSNGSSQRAGFTKHKDFDSNTSQNLWNGKILKRGLFKSKPPNTFSFFLITIDTSPSKLYI
jgi:hypothetical protein